MIHLEIQATHLKDVTKYSKLRDQMFHKFMLNHKMVQMSINVIDDYFPVSVQPYLAFCSPELFRFVLPLLNSCNTRGNAKACLLNPHQREVSYQPMLDYE